MAAPPTPPPLTTARAFDFNLRLLPPPPPHPPPPPPPRGGGRQGGDGTHEEDQPKGELEDRDVADWAADRDVGQRAQRWVLAADRGVPGPQEVDLHRNAPQEGEHVDDRAPAAELERRRLLGPAAEPGAEDCDVAQDIREIDHPGRADRDDARAG